MLRSPGRVTDVGFDNQASDLKHLAAGSYREVSSSSIEARLPWVAMTGAEVGEADLCEASSFNNGPRREALIS